MTPPDLPATGLRVRLDKGRELQLAPPSRELMLALCAVDAGPSNLHSRAKIVERTLWKLNLILSHAQWLSVPAAMLGGKWTELSESICAENFSYEIACQIIAAVFAAFEGIDPEEAGDAVHGALVERGLGTLAKTTLRDLQTLFAGEG